MTHLERVQNPTTEISGPEPVMDVVPHHFFRDDFQLALTRRVRPRRLAVETTGDLYKLRMGEDYKADLFGRKTSEEVFKYAASLTDFFQNVYDLDDDSSVRFGPPDGMCGACMIGNHCRAINYSDGKESYGGYVDDDYITKIKQELERDGFEEGSDFVLKSSAQVFYDYGGNRLSNTTPSPTSTDISTLIARVGALRVVAERQLDTPRTQIEILLDSLAQLQNEE